MERKTAYLLLLLVLFHWAFNIHIITHHKSPQSGSAAQYLRASLQMHNELMEGDIKTALVTEWGRYGPFFFYLTQPFYFLLGRSLTSALFINNLFFALLITSIFYLGKELFSEGAGLLAAVLISFYPQVYGMSRVYILDFGLTALICLGLYLLAKTRAFTDRRFSTFLGIALGLSALIKPVVVIFVIGPVVTALFTDIKPGKKQKKRKVKVKVRAENFLRTLVISLLLYSLLFLRNYRSILQDAKRCITWDFTGGTFHLFDVHNILHWPRVVMRFQVLYFFAIIFVVACGYFLITRQIRLKTKLFLSSFLLIPYIFFTFVVVSNKDSRFILPLTIGISLISSAFLASVRPKIVKRTLIALCIAVALFQFFMLCCGNLRNGPQENLTPFERKYFDSFSSMVPIREWHNGVFEPSANSLAQEEVLDILIDDMKRHNMGAPTVLIPCSCIFSPLGYMFELRNIKDVGVGSIEGAHFEDIEHNYLLILNENGWHDCPTDQQKNLRLLESNRDSYALLKSVEVDTGFPPCPEEDKPGMECSSDYTSIEIYRKSA